MRKSAVLKSVAGRALALALPVLGKSMDCQFAVCCSEGESAQQRHPAAGVYIFWHEYIGALLCQWQRVPMTLLVSQHRDAEWLVPLADAMGYGLVRGSTTRGGASAIRELKSASRNHAIGITPDGPRGPRRELAVGPLWLAARLGVPIYCLAVGMSRERRLKTWDRFAVPVPFGKTRIVFSPPVTISADASRQELESIRTSVQNLMDELHRIADAWADGTISLNGKRPRRQGPQLAPLRTPLPPVALRRAA